MNTREWTARAIETDARPRKTWRRYVGSSGSKRLPRAKETQPTTNVTAMVSRFRAVRLTRMRVMRVLPGGAREAAIDKAGRHKGRGSSLLPGRVVAALRRLRR